MLQRVRSDVLGERPAGEITSTGLTPELLRYFTLDEQANLVQDLLAKAKEQLELEAKPENRFDQKPGDVRKTSLGQYGVTMSGRNLMKEIFAARDIEAYLQEHLLTPVQQRSREMIDELIDEAALLQAMIECDQSNEVVLVHQVIQSLEVAAESSTLKRMQFKLVTLFRETGFDIVYRSFLFHDKEIRVYRVAGPCIRAFTDQLIGSYVEIAPSGRNLLYQIAEVPMNECRWDSVEDDVADCLNSFAVSPEIDHPLSIGPVVQIIRGGRVFDLRSGLTSQWPLIRQFLVRGLPLPAELTGDDAALEH